MKHLLMLALACAALAAGGCREKAQALHEAGEESVARAKEKVKQRAKDELEELGEKAKEEAREQARQAVQKLKAEAIRELHQAVSKLKSGAAEEVQELKKKGKSGLLSAANYARTEGRSRAMGTVNTARQKASELRKAATRKAIGAALAAGGFIGGAGVTAVDIFAHCFPPSAVASESGAGSWDVRARLTARGLCCLGSSVDEEKIVQFLGQMADEITIVVGPAAASAVAMGQEVQAELSALLPPDVKIVVDSAVEGLQLKAGQRVLDLLPMPSSGP